MKKAIWNKTGMKQIINSGWKLFDNQTNCITTGNAYCNTQYSSFIRPYKETECNMQTFQIGHLMRYDMRPFSRFSIPETIREILCDESREESVILYMFFINKDDRVQPFCWVVTDRNYKLIDYRIVCRYGQQFMKRVLATNEILIYITA